MDRLERSTSSIVVSIASAVALAIVLSSAGSAEPQGRNDREQGRQSGQTIRDQRNNHGVSANRDRNQDRGRDSVRPTRPGAPRGDRDHSWRDNRSSDGTVWVRKDSPTSGNTIWIRGGSAAEVKFLGNTNWVPKDGDDRSNDKNRQREHDVKSDERIRDAQRHDWTKHYKDDRSQPSVNARYVYGSPRSSRTFYYRYWVVDANVRAKWRSPFFHLGLLYFYSPKIVVATLPSYTYYTVQNYGTSYYLTQGSQAGLNSALEDIKNAWLLNRGDLIERHLAANTTLSIYLDGQYSYSLPSVDYRDMTLDAMKQIRTVRFTFNDLSRRSDGAYTALGEHQFYDDYDTLRTVYVSYTLARSGSTWFIVATGSSDSRLQ